MTEVKSARYYAAFTIPIKSPNDEHLHMTLAYVGERTAEELTELQKDLEILVNILPLNIKFGEADKFGPNKDIPVRHVSFPDDTNGLAMEAMKHFYAKWYRVTADRSFPFVPHVTLWGAQVEQDSTVLVTQAFIRQAGEGGSDIFAVDVLSSL